MATPKAGSIITSQSAAYAANTLDASDATAKHSLAFAFDSAPASVANLRASLQGIRADGAMDGANDLVSNVSFAAMIEAVPALTNATARALFLKGLQDVRDALLTKWSNQP